MPQTGMTYAGSGVDYESLDPFKLAAQAAARTTANNIGVLNFPKYREYRASRGESVYLIEGPDCYLAQVEEGLGTKNLVADAMYLLTGKSYYDHIAQDTVAMIVNDMITMGAVPLSVAMHLAVAESSWFEDEIRSGDLIDGWKKACDLSMCTWGGGETPMLKGIVVPGTALLSGSAMGIVRPKRRLLSPRNIEDGDAIIICESSGIHANGLTLARQIADNLAEGYFTELSDGRTYGDTLLDPTHIYVSIVSDCFYHGFDVHYAVNITGHGWRKLMRPTQPWTYVIDTLPRQQPIFSFIQEHGPVDVREAYANFNMGAGFALYVPASQAQDILNKLEAENELGQRGIRSFLAGHIEKSDHRRVVIDPVSLEFSGETLAVR